METGYLLHRRSYRETSALVELFTQEHGRLTILVKGLNRAKSAFTGLRYPFKPLLLEWAGRGELKTLARCDVSGLGSHLTGKSLICGLYLNELICRLVPQHEGDALLFECYAQTLSKLQGTVDEQALRFFELHLLESMGYGFVIMDIEPGLSYYFHPLKGCLSYEEYKSMLQEIAPQYWMQVSGNTLLALQSKQLLEKQTYQEAKRLLNYAIRFRLNGAPLYSRTLLQSKKGVEK